MTQTIYDCCFFVKKRNYFYGIKVFDIKYGTFYSPYRKGFEYDIDKNGCVQENPTIQPITMTIYGINKKNGKLTKNFYSKNKKSEISYLIEAIASDSYLLWKKEKLTYYEKEFYYSNSITRFDVPMLVKFTLDDVEEVGDLEVAVRKFKIVNNEDEFIKIKNEIDEYIQQKNQR